MKQPLWWDWARDLSNAPMITLKQSRRLLLQKDTHAALCWERRASSMNAWLAIDSLCQESNATPCFETNLGAPGYTYIIQIVSEEKRVLQMVLSCKSYCLHFGRTCGMHRTLETNGRWTAEIPLRSGFWACSPWKQWQDHDDLNQV